MIADIHIAPSSRAPWPHCLTLVIAALLITSTCMGQGIPNKFVLGSVAYAMPKGALAERLFNLPPTIGLSLGYLFAPARAIQIGATGSWMHFRSRVQFDPTDSAALPDTETTVLQMLALARFRLFKHGFTPYIDLEAGMCYLTHADQVRPCLAGAAGIQIPISDVVDIDARARTSWAPMANDELLVYSVQLGVVYALPR